MRTTYTFTEVRLIFGNSVNHISFIYYHDSSPGTVQTETEEADDFLICISSITLFSYNPKIRTKCFDTNNVQHKLIVT